jgi:PAS domain S-box-containing protein
LLSLCILAAWVSLTAGTTQAIFFAIEGAVLCFWIARVRRTLTKTADGENWHRQLTETTAVGAWVTEEDGVISYANPRMDEILGLLAGKTAGRRAEEFFFPEEIPVERIRVGNRRAGFRQHFDRRLRRKDGSEAWVLVSASALPTRGVLSMMTDITERKRAEHALRRSEQRFRGLFENVLQGVYQSSPQGRILAANPMLLRMLGLNTEADFNDVDIASDLYVDPEIRASLLERLEHEGSFQNVEYSLRRRDGRVIRVMENARAVRGDDGGVLFYEGTLTEITQKRVQDDLTGEDVNNVLTAVSGYTHLILEDLHETHPAHTTASELLKTVESATNQARPI